jgi:DNA polymerase III epsilon subunit family exonuclease
MNLSLYTFVALDLETTWLDPKVDTIIEIAAVRFHLERNGKIFRTVWNEERSMLINPGRKLEENISMITGISDAMLLWKQKWGEVQEKVEAFIGDAIIVWHNVLFDVNMLAAHGIDLSKHISLDTFELSEIFSQDAESLNLGFLGKKYNIQMESEHRALDDTKLSIELFCKYLTDITYLRWKNLNLWHHIKKQDRSWSIRKLLEITEMSHEWEVFILWVPETKEEKKTNTISEDSNACDINLLSLSGNPQEELTMIEDEIKKTWSLIILTPSKKQSSFFDTILKNQWYKSAIHKNKENFCSVEMIAYWLSLETLGRKESIFLLKLTTWIWETLTGLIDELKYYGDERSFIEVFRSDNEEKNYFYEKYKNDLLSAEIVFSDFWTENIEKFPLISKPHSLIVRDIIWSEDLIRKSKSIHISIKELFNSVESIENLDTSTIDDLITGISMISDIYTSTPERPLGEKEFPPGEFWETYLITQRNIWHKWQKWLIFWTNKILEGIKKLSFLQAKNPQERRNIQKLLSSLQILIKTSLIEDINTSIILSISQEDTKISFIPKDIRSVMTNILKNQWWKHIIITWYGLLWNETKKFLENECSISTEIVFPEWEKSLLKVAQKPSMEWEKIVILTTSTKHIRVLVNEYKGKYGIDTIFGQGISWGKWKMLSLFLKSQKKTLLIGLIDSWIDEMELWKSVDTVIIGKIPFDPPTDPYFLARTVWMKNNFEEYSTPIALSIINTLIGRITYINPKAQIHCTDERLLTMNWGIRIQKYFL